MFEVDIIAESRER